MEFNFDKITFPLPHRQMFGGDSEVDGTETESSVRHQRPVKPEVDDYEKDSAWQPSYSPKPSYTTSYNYPAGQQPANKNKATSSQAGTYHHNMPYGGGGGGAAADSYDPKYNNNPEGHGYQAGYKLNNNILNDMHGSSSTTKPKKVKSSGGASIITISKGKGKKHGKRLHTKVKVTQFYKNRSGLETELRPPPSKT